MKKFLFLSLALSMLAAKANADDFYASVSGAVGKIQVKSSEPGNLFSKNKLTPIGGEIAFGTYLAPEIRSELSFSYTEGKKNAYFAARGVTVKGKLSVDTYSLMLNGYYDFDIHSMASPYVMAGIGYAKNRVDFSITSSSNTASIPLEEYSSSKNSLTWQLGVGVDMKAANNVKIGLGYRFRDAKSTQLNLKELDTSFKLKPYHLLLASLKLDF